MSEATPSTTPYLERFERFEADGSGDRPSWLRERRREAAGRFRDLGFPTTRDEEWKNTSVAPIANTAFAPSPAGPRRIRKTDLEGRVHLTGARIVFVNGTYDPDLSSDGDAPGGVRVASLSELLRSDPGSVEPFLARIAPFEDRAFCALNTAFADDGGVVIVPKGAIVAEPIHVLHVASGNGESFVTHPRTLVVAGAGSQAVILETYIGFGGTYLTNAVTEMHLGDEAGIEHCRAQLESPDAFHVATIQAVQGRNSRLLTHNVSVGAALSRHDTGSVLGGEGADCFLNGIYLVDGKSHVDHHTSLDHATPHCTSHEIYKGILGGTSRAVFNGRIIVRPDAQKTDAKQSNRNLLLSDRATVHTRPQLEIYANDVKCTHGATIGRLDEKAMFYLRSRGIGHDAAREMLIHAFAGEVLDRIGIEPLRARLREQLFDRLPGKSSR